MKIYQIKVFRTGFESRRIRNDIRTKYQTSFVLSFLTIFHSFSQRSLSSKNPPSSNSIVSFTLHPKCSVSSRLNARSRVFAIFRYTFQGAAPTKSSWNKSWRLFKSWQVFQLKDSSDISSKGESRFSLSVIVSFKDGFQEGFRKEFCNRQISLKNWTFCS